MKRSKLCGGVAMLAMFASIHSASALNGTYSFITTVSCIEVKVTDAQQGGAPPANCNGDPAQCPAFDAQTLRALPGFFAYDAFTAPTVGTARFNRDGTMTFKGTSLSTFLASVSVALERTGGPAGTDGFPFNTFAPVSYAASQSEIAGAANYTTDDNNRIFLTNETASGTFLAGARTGQTFVNTGRPDAVGLLSGNGDSPQSIQVSDTPTTPAIEVFAITVPSLGANDTFQRICSRSTTFQLLPNSFDDTGQ
ncbi:MAG TPA: hypothetical protein VGU20_08190 [Stellaceae bacterium]|nr:hypothetical protein [Stellaceae bacterium]